LIEKWLCENTVISILDYVEYFRHKIEMLPLQQTVACRSYHPNLVDCLSKMCSSYVLISEEIFPELLETHGVMH
jgi:hypothetical protein